MSKYKAIISDIDGTLAPLTLYSTPSIKVKEAISMLNKRNFIFSLSTGKPFFLIEHLIQELGLTSPIIVDNGAAIYDASTRKPIWQSIMSKDVIVKIFKIAKKYNKRICISSGKKSYDIKENIPNNLSPTKFLTMGFTIDEADKYIKRVESVLKDVAVTRASSYQGENFLDVYITNAEATKQHSILKFAEILNISPKEIIGIGDHYNDFPLLMACGLKVAMGNAVEDLKAIADYVAPTVDEDGVVDVIEKFVLEVK